MKTIKLKDGFPSIELSHIGENIHPSLLKVIPVAPSVREFLSKDPSITVMEIPDLSGNDLDYSIFDFSAFQKLESLIIHDYCFCYIKECRIDGMQHLKLFQIGDKCCPGKDNLDTVDTNSSSFYVVNCPELEQIKIGSYSFRYFEGKFEVQNLAKLQSIYMKSFNFEFCSLVLKGMNHSEMSIRSPRFDYCISGKKYFLQCFTNCI